MDLKRSFGVLTAVCGVLTLFLLVFNSWYGDHETYLEVTKLVQMPGNCPMHESYDHPTLKMVPDVDKWEKTDIDGRAVAILDPWLTREEVISMQKSNWEQPVKVISSCELDAVFSDKSIT
jgi:hypothetical protein